MATEPSEIPNLTRFYLAVGTLLGFIIGFLLLDRFAVGGGAIRLLFLLSVSLSGALAGMLMLRLQEGSASSKREEPEREAPEEVEPDELVTGDVREGGTSKMRFFAVVSSRRSSSDLRTVRIRPHGVPFAPPACQLRLMIEEYEALARVPVLDGVLEKQTVAELLERVRAEVRQRCPRNAENVRFRLVSWRSEGAVREDGRCPEGWTFRLVDGEQGLAVTAIVTRCEIALHYQTTASHWVPVREGSVLPQDARAVVAEAFPEMVERGVRLRVNLPEEVLVYTRSPLAVADVDMERRRVRNAAGLRQVLAETRPVEESFVVGDMERFFRGDDAEVSPDFGAALREPAFVEGLRTLRSDALRRFAYALPMDGLPEALMERLAAMDEREERRALVHVLAHVPSGLVPAFLQRVAATDRDSEIKALAERLHQERRAGQLEVPADPLDAIDFMTLRRMMGKASPVVVPLRSVYEVESEIVAPLAALGLRLCRQRVLSGDQPLVLSALFRADSGDTEALLTSNPLPMPCHILHLVGTGAAGLVDRIEAQGLVYPDDALQRDASSPRPHDVYRAAQYLAALHRPAPAEGASLIAAFDRARVDRNLRRAVLLGLEFTPGPAVTSFLERVREQHEGVLHDLAVAVLERRAERAQAGSGMAGRARDPGDDEVPVAAADDGG